MKKKILSRKKITKQPVITYKIISKQLEPSNPFDRTLTCDILRHRAIARIRAST